MVLCCIYVFLDAKELIRFSNLIVLVSCSFRMSLAFPDTIFYGGSSKTAVKKIVFKISDLILLHRSHQHHQDLILMLQGKNCRSLEKEKGPWQRKNSQRWNRNWKRMWFLLLLLLIVLVLMPFFCALWYPILLIISPQWPFLKDAGLSQTTSFNDHDQSLQENYRIIVFIVKFFKLMF